MSICRGKILSTKQDAAHEPECSHVEHFCETSYLNSRHYSRERLRRVLRKKAAVIIHLTPSHLLIYIFTPSHLLIYIFTPSHLLIYIFTPSHLQIYIFTPSHLQIYLLAPSHLRIFSRSSFYLSLKAGAAPPERHETQPFCTKWTLDVKN